jgi:O-antigen/teichoic acid export membrane protein
VLARAAGTDEMLALRRRMVRTLTVILFPLLALLVVLAPVLVPWLFGPAWEPAVLPTQILAAGGATTLVIDAVGPALMAAGRSKALLGYGVGHFVVYAGAVVVVASHGLAAVAAAAAVHAVFLLVAYQVLLGGRGWLALRTLCTDVAAASVSCLALAAVAAPLAIALDGAGAPVLARLAAVSAAGGVAYLVVLRFGFPAAFADLAAVVRRVLPWRALITQVPGGGTRWSRRTPAKELVTWRSR